MTSPVLWKYSSMVQLVTALFFLSILTVTTVEARGSLPDFTALAEELSPAVVNISTVQKVRKSSDVLRHHLPQMPEGTPFDEFFRRFFGEGGRPDFGYENPEARSLGSGFIISKDGYILTNHHVVENAQEIIVRLNDRRELIAKLIGSDKKSDVALLKVESDSDLPVIKTGDSYDLKVGEWVLAIGSPFGFDYSITAGIVSAKGRSLPSENYVPFIQTDVAINPGNSGGPLINLDGEVVGINSQIYSRTGGFMGLSFAIPIDMAMDIVEQLKESGEVSRGWLGVLIQDVTRDLAESFDMKKPMGALIAQVLPDSPSEKAGLKVGDIIVRFNGHEVGDSSSLPPIVGRTRMNTKVPVEIIRNGKKRTVNVVIGELPADDMVAAGASGDTLNVKELALVVRELNVEQKKRLEEGQQGIYVETVKEGAAAKSGIRKGDIILRVNNIAIESVAQFKKIVEELPAGKSVPLLVQRGSGPHFLALKIPEKE